MLQEPVLVLPVVLANIMPFLVLLRARIAPLAHILMFSMQKCAPNATLEHLESCLHKLQMLLAKAAHLDLFQVYLVKLPALCAQGALLQEPLQVLLYVIRVQLEHLIRKQVV